MTKLVNRAKMSTATAGTGTITLGTAESGYQSFADAGVVNADVVRYVIEDGTDWEIGTGTYTASGTTLSRTVSESSNADAALNLTGSAVVYVSATAEDIPPVLELYAENPSSPTAPSATGTNAVAIGTASFASQSRSVGIQGNSSGTNGVAIHSNAEGNNSVAIGRTSAGSAGYAVGLNSVSIGGSVALGSSSFAASINNGTSTYGALSNSSIAIGGNAKASQSTTMAIGYLSLASGFGSTAIGIEAFSTAQYALSFGTSCTASGEFSLAVGTNTVSATYGKYAFASGRFGSNGDAQTGTFVLRSDTTDATPEALTTNNSTAGTTNQIILPNNSAHAFHGTIVARQDAASGTACAAWKIEGLIRREGSAGTTVLVNSATTVLDNTPAWGMALSADTTNGGLKIEVTGPAATNIRWVATIHTSEVTY